MSKPQESSPQLSRRRCRRTRELRRLVEMDERLRTWMDSEDVPIFTTFPGVVSRQTSEPRSNSKGTVPPDRSLQRSTDSREEVTSSTRSTTTDSSQNRFRYNYQVPPPSHRLLEIGDVGAWIADGSFDRYHDSAIKILGLSDREYPSEGSIGLKRKVGEFGVHRYPLYTRELVLKLENDIILQNSGLQNDRKAASVESVQYADSPDPAKVSNPHSLASLDPATQQTLVDFVERTVLPALFPPPFGNALAYSGIDGIRQLLGYGYEACTSSVVHNASEQSSKEQKDQKTNKRRRLVDDERSEEDDSNSYCEESLQREVVQKEHSQLLACHFHKFDPDKFQNRVENNRMYKTCTDSFKTINVLKQHHKSVHRKDYVCWTCRIIFRKESELQEHAQQRLACEVRNDPDFVIEYIVTEERRKIFKTRKSPKVSREEHWYLMWQILFPDVDPPSDPYRRDELANQETTFLGQRWDQAVAQAMPEAIRMVSTQLGWFSLNEDEVEPVLRDVFDLLRQRMRLGQTSLTDATDTPCDQPSTASGIIPQATVGVDNVPDAIVTTFLDTIPHPLLSLPEHNMLPVEPSGQFDRPAVLPDSVNEGYGSPYFANIPADHDLHAEDASGLWKQFMNLDPELFESASVADRRTDIAACP